MVDEEKEKFEKHVKYLVNYCNVPKKFAGMIIDNYDVAKLANGAHCDENKINYKKFLAYVENIKDNLEKGVGVFFSGSFGVGKTMLMCILLDMLCEPLRNQHNAIVSIKFISGAKLARLLTFDLTSEEKELRDDILGGCHLLAIDDIGRLSLSNNRREMVFVEDVLRDRYLNLLPTLITSQGTVNDLKKDFSDGLADIFRENMVEINFKSNSARV